MLKCLHTTACLQSNPWEGGKRSRLWLGAEACLNFGVLLSKDLRQALALALLGSPAQRNPTAHSSTVIPAYRVKSEREKPRSLINAYMWSLEKTVQMRLFTKQNRDGSREQTYVFQEGGKERAGWVTRLGSTRTHYGARTRVQMLQSCLTLCEAVDCSPSGCSVHGVLQAKILHWVAIRLPPRDLLTQGSKPYPLRLLHCRQEHGKPTHYWFMYRNG